MIVHVLKRTIFYHHLRSFFDKFDFGFYAKIWTASNDLWKSNSKIHNQKYQLLFVSLCFYDRKNYIFKCQFVCFCIIVNQFWKINISERKIWTSVFFLQSNVKTCYKVPFVLIWGVNFNNMFQAAFLCLQFMAKGNLQKKLLLKYSRSRLM